MDIVERLGSLRLSNEDYEVVVDAIDEIERLRSNMSVSYTHLTLPTNREV